MLTNTPSVEPPCDAVSEARIIHAMLQNPAYFGSALKELFVADFHMPANQDIVREIFTSYFIDGSRWWPAITPSRRREILSGLNVEPITSAQEFMDCIERVRDRSVERELAEGFQRVQHIAPESQHGMGICMNFQCDQPATVRLKHLNLCEGCASENPFGACPCGAPAVLVSEDGVDLCQACADDCVADAELQETKGDSDDGPFGFLALALCLLAWAVVIGVVWLALKIF